MKYSSSACVTACYQKEMELQHVTTVKANLDTETTFSKVLPRGQQGGQEVNKIYKKIFKML